MLVRSMWINCVWNKNKARITMGQRLQYTVEFYDERTSKWVAGDRFDHLYDAERYLLESGYART